MMSKSTKLKLGVLSAIVLALLVFLGLDVYNIWAENEETTRILASVEDASNEKSMAQSIRAFQNHVDDEIEVFENLVLTNDSLVTVIESIEEAGSSLGLETNIISVSEPDEKGEEPQKISIIVEADGPWRGNFLFLRAIESLPSRAIIEEASISKELLIWHSRIKLSLFLFNSHD